MEPVGYPIEKIGNPVNVARPAAEDNMAVDKPAAADLSNNISTSTSPAYHAAPSVSAAKPAEKVGPIFPIEGLNPYHNKSGSLQLVLLYSADEAVQGGPSKHALPQRLRRSNGQTRREKESCSV